MSGAQRCEAYSILPPAPPGQSAAERGADVLVAYLRADGYLVIPEVVDVERAIGAAQLALGARGISAAAADRITAAACRLRRLAADRAREAEAAAARPAPPAPPAPTNGGGPGRGALLIRPAGTRPPAGAYVRPVRPAAVDLDF